MKKLIALVCMISWAGFWSFGYLALSASNFDDAQVIVAAILAFAGLVSGVFAYMWLARTYPVAYQRVSQHG
ncbi:hypothetical protein [Tabrizicola sp.]|uniref:hypothetical protein n=1 Tax=Tabrizicola sp. TaxID=2005166 RepID=UPI003D2BCE66